jgi:hypothetical protein
VFLSGLACPILFVTGFIRWRQKAKAKAKQQKLIITSRSYQE